MPAPRPHRVTLVVFLALLTVLLVMNVWMIRRYLLSILMGTILTLLVRPLYLYLMKRSMAAKWAAAWVILATTIVVIVPLGSVATVSIRQGIEFGQRLAQERVLDPEQLTARISRMPIARSVIGDPAQVQVQLRNQIRNIGTTATRILLGILASVPNGVLQIFLALITCYFLLVDGPRFVSWLNQKIPMESDVRFQLYTAFRDTAVSTIWATLAAGTAQALIMFFSYWVLGIPSPFLAAGATFIFAWIPILGSTPVWVAGAIYLFIKGTAAKGVAMILLGLFTSTVDNVIRPYVLKGRSDLHPLVSLIAIFGGIQVFGLFGVFFGPVMVAVLLSMLKVWPGVAERFQLLGDTTTPISPHEEDELVGVEPGLIRGTRIERAAPEKRVKKGSR